MVRLIQLLRILPVALLCVTSVPAEAGPLDSGAADVARPSTRTTGSASMVSNVEPSTRLGATLSASKGRGRLYGQGQVSPAAPRRAPSSTPQDQPSHKWWQSERFKKDLGLTVQLSAQIEDVFQSTIPRLRTLKEDLDRHQALLSVLIKEGTAPETQVAQQVDRVELARSEISKVRTLMLFRMRRLLSTEQRAKMDELHQRWEQDRKEQDRKKGGRPPHP